MSIIERVLERFGYVKNTRLPIRQSKKAGVVTVALKKLKNLYRKGTDDFEEFEEIYTFEHIENAYRVDSYVRRSIDAQSDLMFKNGWKIVSDSSEVREYLNKRIILSSMSTGKPFEILLTEIAEDLIKFHNCFLLKLRGDNPFPALLNINGINGEKPVIGYDTIDPKTVSIKRENGNIKYKIEGVEKILTDKDIIHLYYKRGNGLFGKPFIVSVLDDVKALRQIEENIMKLIHRHLHPWIHYQVGLPSPGYEAEENEVEMVKREIENSSTDAMLVTKENHKITVLGSQGSALNVASYLKYFEERVFTGLGVTYAYMKGDASRAAAAEVGKFMRDRIRAYQNVMEVFLNMYVITEWLIEGGFDPINNSGATARIVWNEIDTEEKRKEEIHTIYKYEHNIISEDEARAELGLDPITDEQRSKMHINITKLLPSKEETDNKEIPRNQHRT